MSQTVVLASGNLGKLAELQHALEGAEMTLQPQSVYEVPDAIEDGLTFIENALKKARHAAQLTGLPAIADDSGLVVPALDGAPGIHSARYSGEGDADNNQKLLTAMASLEGEQRRAWFICVLVYLRSANDPSPVVVEGRWHGRIGTALSGEGGFGYDPLFLPDGVAGTAAELTREQKRALSHRGKAVAQLRQQLGA